MRIAIHAADLDQNRIDGTRVYLLNMLKNFGKLNTQAEFSIYHQGEFNPQLTPPTFENYKIKAIPAPIFWTQTSFALATFLTKPDVLWMPVHNVPILRSKKTKVVVTIHDLAFKILPEYFPAKDLKKLNRLSDLAISAADSLIAVSAATKKDILNFYPHFEAEKITVVPHGYDENLFTIPPADEYRKTILDSYHLERKKYLLYVGAIQPRKNLEILIEAFEKIKPDNQDFKLMLAGAPAWMSENTLKRIAESPFSEDIIVSGTVPFKQLPVLYRDAAAFVFPSMYEGFGIPVLEALASGAPTILADNSSLPEVGGDAALYFETHDCQDLVRCILLVLRDDILREKLSLLGKERVRQFSWEKTAKLTLDRLLNS